MPFCAPGGIRTPNNCFEGRDDIHFTTGAGYGHLNTSVKTGNLKPTHCTETPSLFRKLENSI